MRSLSFEQRAVPFLHAMLVLVIAIGAASCRKSDSPQRRYEQAVLPCATANCRRLAALRHSALRAIVPGTHDSRCLKQKSFSPAEGPRKHCGCWAALLLKRNWKRVGS